MDIEGNAVDIQQSTNYPWEGQVKVLVNPEQSAKMSLMFRIPGWTGQEVVPSDLYSYLDEPSEAVRIFVNGQESALKMVNGFAQVNRKWKTGDEVILEFPMDIKRVRAHELVEADLGQVAIERGPLVYCLEWADQKEQKVLHMALDENPEFRYAFQPELLNGIGVIRTNGYSLRATLEGKVDKTNTELLAIPYYSWANRGRGEMTVWIPEDSSTASPLPAPTIASTSTLSSSPCKGSLSSIIDQLVPEKSSRKEFGQIHWWPSFGTKEWVIMEFEKEEYIKAMKIFWFDDKDINAGCRIPKSYKVYYKSGNRWVPVQAAFGYPNERDQFNFIPIQPVKTRALKLQMELEEDFSTGIQEWVVIEA